MSATHQSIVSIPAAAGLSLLLAVAPASTTRADFTWDGGGGGDFWTGDLNWVGDVAPDFDVGDMLLIFGPTGGAESPDAANNDWFNIAGLRWTNADSELTLIGGGTLTFNDGASILNDSLFLQTVNINLVGTGDELILDAMSANLDIGGDIDLTAGTSLIVQGAEDTIISGIISGNNATVVKNDAGELTLSGENTYGGGTELNDGTIILGDDAALGTGRLTVMGDAGLASSADGRTITNGVTINQDVTLSLTGSNNLRIDAQIEGDGTLEIDADDPAARFTLSRRNLYTGDTSLRDGTVVLAHNRALSSGRVVVKGEGGFRSDNDSRQISNDIVIRENANLTFSGNNNLDLNGVISGGGTFTVDSGNINDRVDLNNANTFTGGVILRSGALGIGDAEALGTADVNVAGDSSIRSVDPFSTITVKNDFDLHGNNLQFNGNSDLIIDGTLTGNGGSLRVRAAEGVRLTLNAANSFTGQTRVQRGELFLAGSVAGDVRVHDEGFFLGDGRVNGSLLVEDGGTVSPSVGVNSMRIKGDFTLDDGGVYAVDIDTDSADADFLRVDGMTTLADDATIEASVSGNMYATTGQQFVIIRSDGGITDNGVDIEAASATLTFELIRNTDFMNGDDMFALEVFRAANAYSAAATGANNTAIGMSLDSLQSVANASPGGGAADILGTLDALDDDAYNNALNELNPEPYNSVTALAAENLKVYNHQLSNYLSARRDGIQSWRRLAESVTPKPGSLALSRNDPALLAAAIAQMEEAQDGGDDASKDMEQEQRRGFDERLGTFAQFHGTFIDLDSSGNRTGYDANLFGATAGLDYQINNNTVTGVAIGYQFTDADFKSSRGMLKDNSIRIGPFASYQNGPWFADASLSFGWHMYDVDRDQLTLGRTAKADFDGYDLAGYLRGGYDYEINDWMYITPHASLQYTYLDVDGFTESGAGGANLNVDSRDSDSLRTRLGTALNWKFDVGLVLMPTVYGGWEHEWLEDDNLDASFAAGGTPFSVDTGNREEDAFYFGAGVNVLFQRNVSGFLRFERQWGDDSEIIGVAGGLTFRF